MSCACVKESDEEFAFTELPLGSAPDYVTARGYAAPAP